MDDKELELWKDIKGFEGKYQVSNLGRVRSIKRTIINKRGRKQSFKELINGRTTLKMDMNGWDCIEKTE